MSAVPVVTAHAEGVPAATPTLAGHVKEYLGRLRGGDMGALPAIIGLITLGIGGNERKVARRANPWNPLFSTTVS